MPLVSHLYIHIPFCESRCHYCDFFSTDQAGGAVASYLTALLAELESWELPAGSLDTIYIGGGTPTFAGADRLSALLDALRPLAAASAEVTMEANPLSFSRPLAEVVAAAGVNRLSLGAQSFDPGLRRRLGRRGDAGDVEQAVAAARAVGIGRLGIDLLFALPGQTGELLSHDLEQALALGPEHISCYELTVKPGSPFYRRWRVELMAAQEGARRQYELVSAILEGAGYGWYETSNYARHGNECRHNLAYWSGEDYIGIGAGAWGTVGSRRWRNCEDIDAYIRDFRTGRREESLSREQKLVEAVMLGLRTDRGVALDRVAEVIDQRQLELLGQNGFIVNDGAKILLARAGRFVANEVCARIIDPHLES